MNTILNELLIDNQPFCLIQKQDSDEILLLIGRPIRSRLLQDIPRRRGPAVGGRIYDTISIVPFCQIREKGCPARDAGEEILTIEVESQHLITSQEITETAAKQPLCMTQAITYDTTPEEYAAIITQVIEGEIGNGEGANFVIPRTATGRIADFSIGTALTIFRSLVERDFGTYWKFLFVHTDRIFVGSTPERHLQVEQGRVRMNPISGTFCKAEQHLLRARLKEDLLAFINDRKEINELFMVVDEEMKMMARMCEKGGVIIGPLLKEMSRLIHTEYLLSGLSDKDIFELFRESMFAATVIGSPVENACAIIEKYSRRSRRYYGSALMLAGRDENGADFLDAPITIRTVEIESDGNLHLSVGATLVRDSQPDDEVKETEAKAGALIDALVGRSQLTANLPLLPRLANDDDIIESLLTRNEHLSHFWFFHQVQPTAEPPDIHLNLTLIHNGDDFIYMLRHILRALGLQTTIVPWSLYDIDQDTADITLIGPGPGNPNDDTSAKIRTVMTIVRDLLCRGKSILCVCLGHQLLCRVLGLVVEKRQVPLQGIQLAIDFFGRQEKVGFYNTFIPKWEKMQEDVEISLLPRSNDLVAIRGHRFSGLQFHPESILSQNGYQILADEIRRLGGQTSGD